LALRQFNREQRAVTPFPDLDSDQVGMIVMGEMKHSLAPPPHGQEIQFITSPQMHSPDKEKLGFFYTAVRSP
jgi:hypothetical protein